MSAFTPQQSRVKVGFPFQCGVTLRRKGGYVLHCTYMDEVALLERTGKVASSNPMKLLPPKASPSNTYLLSQCTSAPIFQALPKARNSFRRKAQHPQMEGKEKGKSHPPSFHSPPMLELNKLELAAAWRENKFILIINKVAGRQTFFNI